MKRILSSKNVGTYSIKTAKIVRRICKFLLGKRISIVLRGRGKRAKVVLLDGTIKTFYYGLPLQYAQKAAIYVSLYW